MTTVIVDYESGNLHSAEKSFQRMAGSMTGMTEEEYRAMMLAGGRSAEGNRYIGEDGDAQAHRQPQGAAGKKGN